jgi:hypothetical protein
MRFYKPRLREYVSTQVDMPWEFLQGVAEKKQKGYDTALATGDAAANLLNFEVIPGDVQFKSEIQKKYNNRILEAQKYVQQTGDFNKASRDLASIVRDIAQDPYINNMKAAVPIWKEQRKSEEELDSAGEILDFNRNSWDYMYSTVDKETGATRSYNQKLPYKARTLGKAFYDDVKDSIDGRVIQQFGDRVQKVNGEWISKKTGKRLGSELLPIMATALDEIIPRYPNYFRDRTKYEIQQGVSKQNETPNWIDKMTKALAAEYHVDNVEYDYKYDELDLHGLKKQKDEESKIISFTGATVPTNINYTNTKNSITNITNQIEQLQDALDTDESLNTMQKQRIQQEMDGLKSQLSMHKSQMDLVHKTMTSSNKYGINLMYDKYKETLAELDPKATPYSMDEFKKYMKEEKQIINPRYGANITSAISPQQALQNKHMSALSAVKSNVYDQAATKVASSGAVLNEIETLVDLQKNSNINRVTDEVLTGLFNNTLNGTTAEGININDLIKKEGAIKEKSEISLVKNPVSSEITYKVILRDATGNQVGEHLINTNKSSPQIKQVISTGLISDMKTSAKTGNKSSFLSSASALAHTEYASELAILRNYANNNQVIKVPLKIGDYYVINAVDNNNKPIPNQFMMAQGTIDNLGNVIIASNTMESNPNDPNSNILFYGDIESKLGVTLYTK